jgi:hypothetical protein
MIIASTRTYFRLLTCTLLFGMLAPVGDCRALEDIATFTVDARFGTTPEGGMQAVLRCGVGEAYESRAWLPDRGTTVFSLNLEESATETCVVAVEPPAGMLIRYQGDGGSAVEISDQGCHFSAVRAGHFNFCQVQADSRTTSLIVYKKWIGATGEEADVAVQLVCDGEILQGPREINVNKPGGWTLDLSNADGIVCGVHEVGRREEFVPDESDCRNLVVLPGSEEECTMVNTKVVKMIDMLNRYGLGIMILVFMVAGMLAARRFVP